MTNEKFLEEVAKAIERSNDLLNVKGKEYGSEEDRLVQFKVLATLENRNPAESLFSLMAKHVTSIALMVNEPLKHSKAQWDGKLDDLRNYSLLLDTLLTDMKE